MDYGTISNKHAGKNSILQIKFKFHLCQYWQYSIVNVKNKYTIPAQKISDENKKIISIKKLF